ncbi:MAG: peptidoglycan recognition family protein [Bryobacterales bacterium]|nr:peptidoglycan recognition protein family protein [Bryobacteraceae bacterium]MDW8356124.1 peptidoglycan recognition family protein [Bryobacterales bacterium]
MESYWPEEGELRSIEQQAASIGDPVRKLRYLRAAIRLQPRLAPQSSLRGQRYPKPWAYRAAALVAALLALPAPPSADVDSMLVSVPAKPRPLAEPPPTVWLVERADDFEHYSNGLRIENLFQVRAEPRGYWRFPLDGLEPGEPQWSREPAGIVFHSTESHAAEFEPERTGPLRRAGLNLLAYVRQHRSYHFVVDRFGRVHRIVSESDIAHHAGWSAWSDGNWIYLGLNQSFLAVAFETRTEQGLACLTDAQVRSGRMLTEMLRARHRIPAVNCVTHAQVSLNPHNRRIAYHTDWASGFPFAELGLPNNYALSPAAVLLFGFHYDERLLESGRPGMWQGLQAAARRLLEEASAQGWSVKQYRAVLLRRYQQLVALAAERDPKEAWP